MVIGQGRVLGALLCAAMTTAGAWAQGAFVNFETPMVAPLALSPDGDQLAVCNLPDGVVDLMDLTVDPPVRVMSIPVGIDPVSVKFRTDTEIWVVNHISDSVSVVDLALGAVVATLITEDEPNDVVFAGDPQRAFVSCGQTDAILVFDPANLAASPQRVALKAEKPRMLAVSPDGSTVYCAIFESGNGTTILGGGTLENNVLNFPPNVVSNAGGPYNGVNPPPNAPVTPETPQGFDPPFSPGLAVPPRVGLIVRLDDQGFWRDENGADWTSRVSGAQASTSGRPVGWTLLDNDIAVIDANTLALSYVTRIMNIGMAISVNPATGLVHLVGTEALNEIRFEPVINGTFARVMHAVADPTLNDTALADLNPHLDYQHESTTPDARMRSIGDPRAMAWSGDGSVAYIAGMGSNNIVAVDEDGTRFDLPGTPNGTIPVGQGPSGLSVDEARNRLYVLNRFDMSLSIIDTETNAEVRRLSLHDSTPEAVRKGRPHLYNTHLTSGNGHVACATCHVDSRKDRIGWDLGDPSQAMRAIPPVSLTNPQTNQVNRGAGVPGLSTGMSPFHPMKGPMTTQTLQDIIGHEPHHWRGDRTGIEQFNGAFTELQGADTGLTPTQMQEFEDFLGTIHFPPNPFRNADNTLPTNLPLDGHFTVGRFGPAGQPMPNGNAVTGLARYRNFNTPLDQGVFACSLCHALPTGGGTNTFNVGGTFQEIPPGPMGEAHTALVGVDGSTNFSMKVAHLRNIYDKTGLEFTQIENTAGFGFLHDGSVDSITRFLAEPAFNFNSDQDLANMVALMLAFSGSEFGAPSSNNEPPGVESQDVHAGVGDQLTTTGSKADSDFLDLFEGEAARGVVDLIVRTADSGGMPRGYLYLPDEDVYLPDSMQEEPISRDDLLTQTKAINPLTFTVTPWDSGFRLAIDRDGDGLYNFDEIRDWNPVADGIQNPFDPANPDSGGNDGSNKPDGIPDGDNDFNGNGISNAQSIAQGGNPLQSRPEDITYTGSVTAVDVQLVINAALGIDVSPVDADVNGDNTVDALDVQVIINAALGVT